MTRRKLVPLRCSPNCLIWGSVINRLLTAKTRGAARALRVAGLSLEILVHTALATSLAAVDAVFKERPFLIQVVPRHHWVIQVIDDGASIHKLARMSQVIHPSSEIGVR